MAARPVFDRRAAAFYPAARNQYAAHCRFRSHPGRGRLYNSGRKS